MGETILQVVAKNLDFWVYLFSFHLFPLLTDWPSRCIQGNKAVHV